MRTEVTAVSFAAPGGAFLILAFLQRRTGSTNITSLSGVIRSVPLLSALFLLFALAAIGLPEPWSIQPDSSLALQARPTDEASISEFHQGQRHRLDQSPNVWLQSLPFEPSPIECLAEHGHQS